MFNFIQKVSKIKLPFFTPLTVYLDLGTFQTKIAIKDKGIIIKEPTFIAYNTKTKEFIFAGEEAKQIIGKTPDFIKIIRPVVNGVISDFDSQVALLKNYFQQSVHFYTSSKFIKPIIEGVATVPTIATEIEQKAVEEAIMKVGVSHIYLVEKSIATAAGCGINVFSNQPHLIIDLGGGLIEMSIISSGGIVSQKILKSAGDQMNKTIYNYIYLKYGIILGETTCESLKIQLLNFNNEEKVAAIRGKSLETGLPKSVRIKTTDIKESLLSIFNQIIDATKELIENSAPEILDELLRQGVILTGGLAQIEGIEKFFSNELRLDTYSVSNPQDTTINGLIKLGKGGKDILKLALR